ncbi:hypothetical protein ADK77_06565 [Streptomyces antibioticus]|nr:hypothetical protein ADK77_06565 [Streptomyces antibioticus]
MNDPDAGDTYIHTVDGVVTEEFRRLRLPFGLGVLGKVAGCSRPMQTRDYLVDTTLERVDRIDGAVAKEGVRAILGAPMIIDEDVIGALLVACRYPRTFDPTEISILSSLASLAAVSFETTNLIDTLSESLRRLELAESERVRHITALERAARDDHELFSALVNDFEVKDYEGLLSRLIERPVIVLASEGLPGRHDPRLGRSERLIRLAAQSDASGEVVIDRSERPFLTVLAVHVGGRARGYICVLDAVAEEEVRLIQRGAMTLAARFLFDEALRDALHRERTELVQQLLSGRASSDDYALAERLSGLRMDSDTSVMVLRTGSPAAALRLVGRVHGDDALMAAHEGRVCILLAQDAAEAVGRRVLSALAERGIEATCGIFPLRGRHTVSDAYGDADALARALAELDRVGELATETDLGSVGLLLGASNEGFTERLVRRVLGKVLEHDEATGSDLATTALAYLDANFQVARAADELNVHQNTLRQRLGKLDRLLGESWRSGSRSLDVHLALRTWDLGRRAR